MLMLVYGIGEQQAFELLRSCSQHTNVRLRELAQRVLTELPPAGGQAAKAPLPVDLNRILSGRSPQPDQSAPGMLHGSSAPQHPSAIWPGVEITAPVCGRERGVSGSVVAATEPLGNGPSGSRGGRGRWGDAHGSFREFDAPVPVSGPHPSTVQGLANMRNVSGGRETFPRQRGVFPSGPGNGPGGRGGVCGGRS
ncbi:ANTAR domain-containing protein [Nocardia gipuzkoensis]|uniref:ANTAR domain-containing protein n=1 Tax=Nocardia abscessus TaxID=120957 RepID=UPI0015EF25AE